MSRQPASKLVRLVVGYCSYREMQWKNPFFSNALSLDEYIGFIKAVPPWTRQTLLLASLWCIRVKTSTDILI